MNGDRKTYNPDELEKRDDLCLADAANRVAHQLAPRLARKLDTHVLFQEQRARHLDEKLYPAGGYSSPLEGVAGETSFLKKMLGPFQAEVDPVVVRAEQLGNLRIPGEQEVILVISKEDGILHAGHFEGIRKDGTICLHDFEIFPREASKILEYQVLRTDGLMNAFLIKGREGVELDAPVSIDIKTLGEMMVERRNRSCT